MVTINDKSLDTGPAGLLATERSASERSPQCTYAHQMTPPIPVIEYYLVSLTVLCFY